MVATMNALNAGKQASSGVIGVGYGWSVHFFIQCIHSRECLAALLEQPFGGSQCALRTDYALSRVSRALSVSCVREPWFHSLVSFVSKRKLVISRHDGIHN
eukprot:6180060-Pleurochrysis_carterae.AAC.1